MTTTIANNTNVGTISISTGGTYIIFLNVIIQTAGTTAIIAYLNNIPTSSSLGFSSILGTSPYFQTSNAVYFVTFTGSYSLSVNTFINSAQVSLVTNAYLDYSYMRIA